MAKVKGGTPVYNPRPDVRTSIAQGTGMQAVPNPERIKDWQDVVEQDPNLRGKTPEQATNYLRAAWGLPNSYKLDGDGNIADTHGFVVRNLWWIGPAALVGGSAIAAGASGAGGGAATTAATGTGAGTAATGAAPYVAAEHLAAGSSGFAPGFAGSAAAGVPAARTVAAPPRGGGPMANSNPWIDVGVPAVGNFVNGLFNGAQNSRDQEANRKFLQEQQDRQIAANREHDLRNAALEESKLDPFRNVNNQLASASASDRAARSTYSPVNITRGPGGARTRTGGNTYTRSPELLQAARRAALMVLSGGGQAPSMQDPANYGQTGVQRLTGPALPGPAGGGDDDLDPWMGVPTAGTYRRPTQVRA